MSCSLGQDGWRKLLNIDPAADTNCWRVRHLSAYASAGAQCLCGEQLMWGYHLLIKDTGELVGPIRAACLLGLDDSKLVAEAKALIDIAHLRAELKKESLLFEFSAETFSPELLTLMHEDEVFEGKLRGWSGYRIYRFMSDMLKKRSRAAMSLRETKLLDTVMNVAVEPYLLNTERVVGN